MSPSDAAGAAPAEPTGVGPASSTTAPAAVLDEMPAPMAGPIPLPADLPTVPPTLLHARHIRDAHEILVLSYTSDLQFFESTCLGDALASTGRITIVRDADKGVPAAEPRLVGTRYLDVPVRCKSGGAFHPKLMVIASPDRAVAVIGSGNVTASGWHYNAELWTVIVGEGETWPTAFAELAEWLIALPDVLLIDEFGAHRIRDVAAMLANRQYAGGPALVHNLSEPILTQLPETRTRHLGVASPFLDSKAAALQAVRARLSPESVEVALTRGASFDADTLADVLEAQVVYAGGGDGAEGPGVAGSQPAGPVASAALIKSPKYHHGKLLEWEVAEGERFALVGSANCTAAAMLRTARQQYGNCELGLILNVTGRHLMPVCGEPLDRDGLIEHALAGPPLPSDRAAFNAFIARALRTPSGLRVTVLATSADALEAASIIWKGEAYAIKLEQPETGECFAFVLAPAGELVSVRFADLSETAPVRVTDPARVMVRLEKPSPLEQHTLQAVLSDPSLTEELLNALEQLATIRPTPASRGTSTERTPAQWLEEWSMAAAAALGPSLVALALGTDPGAAESGTDMSVLAFQPGMLTEDPFADQGELGDIDVEDEDLLEDMLDAELTAAEKGELPPRTRLRAERHRKRVVRLLRARAETASTWELPAQISLLRVLIVSVASGLFHGENWSAAVAALARAIARPSAPADASAPTAAGKVESADTGENDSEAVQVTAEPVRTALMSRRLAITTVCLAMIARDVEDWAESSAQRDEFHRVREVLPEDPEDLELDLLRAYAQGLDRLLGVMMSAEAIIDSLEHLLGSTSLQRLSEALSGGRMQVEIAGPRLLRLTGKGAPRALAYRVLQKAQDEGALVVVCENASERLALAWAKPDIFEVSTTAQRRHGWHFRPVIGMGSVAAGETQPLRKWRGELPPEVRDLLDAHKLPHTELE